MSKVVVVKDCARMVDNLEHPSKTLHETAYRLVSKFTVVREVQPLKTPEPSLVIYGGSETEVKDEQPRKENSPRQVMF